MYKKWWWNRNARTRRFFLVFAQIVFLAVFVALLCQAGLEAMQENPDTVRLNLFVLAFVAQLAIAGFILSRQKQLPWYWREFVDLRHEFTGALVLSVLLLFLVTIPAEQKAEYQLKQQLIREMGANDNGIALRAVRELKAQGWLSDGSMRGIMLVGANLQDADMDFADLIGSIMIGANLEWADLVVAKLQMVNLTHANLESADLSFAGLQWAFMVSAKLKDAYLAGADLENASLVDANLQGASLERANLEKASLLGANLRATILLNANLKQVNIAGATFDEDTVLPDGTNWALDTDMGRFTDPDHPEFWRPEPGSVGWYPENGE